MNERMQCDKPQRIVFLISEENMDSCREELEEACRYFERCKVRGTIEQISGKDMDVPDQAEGVLYITDQEDVCQRPLDKSVGKMICARSLSCFSMWYPLLLGTFENE